MRYFALFFAVLFVLFAAVQYNDPDPWFWIPVYLIPAVISFLVFRGTYPVAALWIAAALFLVGAIYWLPPNMSEWLGMEQEASTLEMRVPFIEEAREAMGLFVVVVAMVIYLIAYYSSRRALVR